MLDYAGDLRVDLPHRRLDILAAVSRQFSTGVALLRSLRDAHRLGTIVICALGTNGPISGMEIGQLAQVVAGAERVVIVNVHVDRPWQAEVNGELRLGAARIPHAVLVNWAKLADEHPGWLYSDGTHLPIDGTGAAALARAIARAATLPS